MVRAGARRAACVYGRAFRAVLRPIGKVEAEAHHLHEVERAGAAGDTPFIVMLGLIFFLVPIFCIMAGLAFAAYYLTA